MLAALGRVGSQLLNTFVLCILAIFIFAIVGYSVFRTDPVTNTPPCGTL